jgi:hypothetical protein
MTHTTLYRMSRISQGTAVRALCAKMHLDTSDAAAVLLAFAALVSIDCAPSRELAVFAGAVVRCHRSNQTQYSVAIRRAS